MSGLKANYFRFQRSKHVVNYSEKKKKVSQIFVKPATARELKCGGGGGGEGTLISTTSIFN